MSLSNAINGKLFTYISSTINFKTVGDNTIFTTEFGLPFVTVMLNILCDSATAANGDGSFNLGTNSPNFDNWISGGSLAITNPDNYISFVTDISQSAVFAASTPVVFRVSMGDSGTSLTGRAIITGYYLG
jgi:hypothetical protein